MQLYLTFASRSAYIHTKYHQHRNHNTRDQQYLFCHFEYEIEYKTYENSNPQNPSVYSLGLEVAKHNLLHYPDQQE